MLMKVKFIILCVMFYCFSLLYFFPAEQALRFLPKNQGVELTAVSGSIWKGKAEALTVQNQVELKKVSWKMNFLSLLLFSPKVEIFFSQGDGFLLLSGSGIHIEDLSFNLPANTLVQQLELPIAVESEGDIKMHISYFSQGEPYCKKLNATLLWENAILTSEGQSLDLGEISGIFKCNKGQIVGQLLQNSDALNSELNVVFKEKKKYSLDGKINGTQLLDPMLEQALSFLAPKDNSGTNIISYSGVL